MQKVSDLRHIIVGGNGFLGKKIVENLVADNKKVTVVDKNIGNLDTRNVKVLKCDIANFNDVLNINLSKNDVIHHLASNLIIPNKPRFNRYEYFSETTIKGTQNIIELMKKNNCNKMVFWSTDMVYGIYQDKIINEKNKTQPFGDYGNTKVKAELLIKNAIKKNNLNCTIFRPRLILGPSRLGILKNLFNLIRLNLPVPLIGDGDNFFQFISVQDCAKASIMAAEKNCPSETYNLGSKKPYKIKNILKNLIRHAKSKSILIPLPEIFIINVLNFLNFFKISPLDIEQYKIANQNVILDTSKVCKDLGWESVLDDSDVLLQTYDYYIKQSNEKNCNF